MTTRIWATSAVPAIGKMAARKDRIKSAQPCLNRDAERLEAKEANESKKDEPVSRASSSMRVQSARERKLSQEASHVFPNELSSPSQVGARWKTIYKEDYESKTSTRPSSARPTSPTRRNNPHPRQVWDMQSNFPIFGDFMSPLLLQSFLTWKVPSRRLSRDEDDGVDPIRLQERLEEFEADVSEDFQRDYKDSRNGTVTGAFSRYRVNACIWQSPWNSRLFCSRRCC